jgi:hypothetical protein
LYDILYLDGETMPVLSIGLLHNQQFFKVRRQAFHPKEIILRLVTTMKKQRLRSTWLSHKNTRIYCIDFSGYGSDRDGVLREIAAADKVLAATGANSLLVTLDLSLTPMMPEMAAFISQRARGADDPVRKMGILGISGIRRWWYQVTKKITWPGRARFFPNYEEAKNWIVAEGF